MKRSSPAPFSFIDILAPALVFCLGLLLLHPSRLEPPLRPGTAGTNNAAFANYCRSLHRAPWTPEGLLPAYFRTPAGRVLKQQDYYVSQHVWPYQLWAGLTRFTGVSTPAVRALAALTTLMGAALLHLLWRRRGGPAFAVAGVFLYATSPLTLAFGTMLENMLLTGIALLIAAWGYGKRIGDADGPALPLWQFTLACLPLLLVSIHMGAFFIAAVFFTHWLLARSLRAAVITALPLLLLWLALTGFHLWLARGADLLDLFRARAERRSILEAFSGGDNPLLDVLKHWVERIGVPLLVCAGLGAWLAFRRRRDAPRRFAFTLAVLLSCGLYCLVLMQLVAHHRYMLQACLPPVAFLAAPGLAWLCRREGENRLATRARHLVAALVVATGLGLGFHQVRKHESPTRAQQELAYAAYQAAERVGEDERVLLVLAGDAFGQLMIVQHYCYRALDLVRLDRDDSDANGIRDYAALAVAPALSSQTGTYGPLLNVSRRCGHAIDLARFDRDDPDMHDLTGYAAVIGVQVAPAEVVIPRFPATGAARAEVIFVGTTGAWTAILKEPPTKRRPPLRARAFPLDTPAR